MTPARLATLRHCLDWSAPFEIAHRRHAETGEIVDLGGLRNTLGWLRNRGLVEYGMANDTYRVTVVGRAALTNASRDNSTPADAGKNL